MYFIYNHQHVEAFRRQRYVPARPRIIRAEREQIRRRIEAIRRPAKAA
ncbi:MAG TPA: hypothetical protein VJR05_10340 [Acidimicrobiia bacterium]|nr:hypothetical protein [Acidimicrobiia bacterium]